MSVSEWLRTTVSSNKFCTFVLVLFVALRVPIFIMSVTPYSDGAWYVARATDIWAGRGYAENGVPTAYWPVGYPGFLAGVFSVFGPSLFVVKMINLLFGGA